MIKKLTVNGITETISNVELHVEEENEKEGVLVFNGEVFGENIEKISRIKIGDKFYALSNASEEGIAVPTEGLVEKIYFNTELSSEDVCKVFSAATGLSLTSDRGTMIFAHYNISPEKDYCIYMSVSEGGLAIGAGVTEEEIALFSSYDIDSEAGQYFGFTGWNPDFNGCLEIGLENQIGTTGAELFNDKLTALVSLTPSFDDIDDIDDNSNSSGVELFNIAELMNINNNSYNAINYEDGEGSYDEYIYNNSGYGQMILDAFNAGKKIVYIGNTTSWTNNSCSFCQEAFYVGDLDTTNDPRFPNFQYVVVLFHGIEWNNNNGQMYKPRIQMLKFPK